MPAKRKTGSYKKKLAEIASFFDDRLALYSGSMSFITIFSFVPFMMLCVFAAVNVIAFDGYFQSFKVFLYENLFEGSADSIVGYLDGFLQNSKKLGLLGLLFAIYSVYVFIKQLDFCVSEMSKQKPDFTAARFIKYLVTVLALIVLTSFSTLIESALSYFGFGFLGFLTTVVQIWIGIFVFFNMLLPVYKGIIYTFLDSFIASFAIAGSKKLFVYYVVTGTSYTTIYGPFATIFIFFVWLNLSWYIFFAALKLHVNRR